VVGVHPSDKRKPKILEAIHQDQKRKKGLARSLPTLNERGQLGEKKQSTGGQD